MDARREQALVDLLRREAALRKSKTIQDDMEKAEESAETEWMGVIADLQRRIVDEYLLSFSDEANSPVGASLRSITVMDLRLATLRHPEVTFWIKNNRARQGPCAGEKAPDVRLCRAIDGTETFLLKQEGERVDSPKSLATTMPLVVFAGSLS